MPRHNTDAQPTGPRAKPVHFIIKPQPDMALMIRMEPFYVAVLTNASTNTTPTAPAHQQNPIFRAVPGPRFFTSTNSITFPSTAGVQSVHQTSPPSQARFMNDISAQPPDGQSTLAAFEHSIDST